VLLSSSSSALSFFERRVGVCYGRILFAGGLRKQAMVASLEIRA
jgi:hypothetical protein